MIHSISDYYLMNTRARRLLRWTFTAAFFIIAPAIILSTAGYRYNFSRGQLERTGVMLVESRPTGASISLNGIPQKSETPARLQRLSPGPYEINVKKNGYHAWKKVVAIRSRETTFQSEINLFRESVPELLVETGTSSAETFSHDARYAASIVATRSGSELVIIDLRDASEVRPYRTTVKPSELELSWSRDGRRLLIHQNSKVSSHLLWNSSEPSGVQDIEETAGFPIDSSLWAQDTDKLYVSSRDVLYELNMELSLASSVGPAPDSSVVAHGSVYGIRPGFPATLVMHRLYNDKYETIAELPSADFTPLRGRDRKITYLSTTSDRLFVIDASVARPKAFEGNGHGGTWSADGKRLIYWNDLEVRLYDTTIERDGLVARLSGPIGQAVWHRPEWNALYSSGNSVFAVETSDQFGRVTVPLSVFDELREFTSSRNGDYLYAFGKIGEVTGLWKLRLR